MPYLKLQSSDGEVFQVETQIAKQSNTIRTMLEGNKNPVIKKKKNKKKFILNNF